MDVLVVAWVAMSAAVIAFIVFGHLTVRPLIRTWMEVLRIQDEMLPMLKEVVSHVRTDSGASLLDIVKRLDDAAQAQVTVARIMAATLERMEGKADMVAEDLAVSQSRADEAIERGEEAGVASDEASATPDG